jgi:hypothetical protein
VKRLIAIAPLFVLLGCSTLASKGAVVGCQAADAGTTLHAMELGARELNPIVGAMLNTLGPTGFVLAKAGVTLFLLNVHSTVPMGIMAVANGITCGAAANNTAVAARLSRERKEKERKEKEQKEVGRGGEI